MGRHTLFGTVVILLHEAQAVGFRVAILFDFTLLATIKRRSSDIQVTLLDEFGHVAVEKRHQQCVDVGTIDIGIGHDDYFIIA